MPRLNGSLSTRAPFAAATAAVRSAEPSSITTTSRPGSNARSSSIRPATVVSSLRAGTIATRRSSDSPGRAAAGEVASRVSGTGGHRDAEVEQLEESPRAMRIRVLVEHTLARAPSHLLRLRGVGEQVAVRLRRLVGIGDDEQLPARLEPALDP